ncbi:MAG: hypothetical protein ACP5GY_00305 [Vulcanisaeta sp.]
MGGQKFSCMMMGKRPVIIYLINAAFYLIMWIINTTNIISLIASLVFIVLSFVAMKPPKIPAHEERRFMIITSILIVLFFIVCLPISIYLAVKQPIIGITIMLAFPSVLIILLLGLIAASYVMYGVCR